MKKCSFIICTILISISVFGQQVSMQLLEEWQDEQWVGFSYMINTYDDNDLKVKILNQFWDEMTQSFEDDEEIRLLYNNDKNVDYIISQIVDPVSGDWVNFNRIDYSYNQDNQVSESVSHFWEADEWYVSEKTVNIYEGNGLLSESLRQIMNHDSNTYENFSRDLKSYNSEGDLEQNINQRWNNTLQEWENQRKTMLEYNDGLLKYRIENKWAQDSWINFTRENHFYHVNNQMDYFFHESWNNSTNSYEITWRNTAIYNNDGTVFQYLYELLNSGNWINDDRITFTYQTTVGIEEVSLNGIIAYPNPTKDYIYFSENVNVRVRNSAGQLILAEDSSRVLDLTHQASGIYFLHLSTPSGESLKTMKISKD